MYPISIPFQEHYSINEKNALKNYLEIPGIKGYRFEWHEGCFQKDEIPASIT